MSKDYTPLMVGVALDILDYIALGLVPILADIIDIVGVFYFWRKIGYKSAFGLIELVPIYGDLIPTFTFLGAYSVWGKR